MKKDIFRISIISSVLALFLGCGGAPKMIKELSEICNQENVGERVEIEGYFGVGDSMTCVSKSDGSDRCALQFRTNSDDKGFITVLVAKASNQRNAIERGELNIEALEIRDSQNKPVPPRAKVTLIGYVQPSDKAFDKYSDRCLVLVNEIKVDKETAIDNRYCSETQRFDSTGEDRIKTAFKLREVVGSFSQNDYYSRQNKPSDPKRLCGSFAEGTGNYKVIEKNKTSPDLRVFHRIALYNTPDQTEKGLKEYLEIQKRKGAEVISDIEVAADGKVTFSFKEGSGDRDGIHQINCHRDENKHAPLRMVCHEFFSDDETRISKYIAEWTDFETDLKELLQKEPIDTSSMTPTEVLKHLFKARQGKDAVNYINSLSDRTVREVFAFGRDKKEELTLAVRDFLDYDYSPVQGEPQIRDEQIDGNKATAEVKTGDAWLSAAFVKEDGRWRLESDK